MTCCVAALCDDGKTLILISDRMFATWAIESELDINKLRTLSSRWWVLFSGDDIRPVFDIIDWTKASIAEQVTKLACGEDSIPLKTVMDCLQKNYEKKRLDQAEALYLTPTGWNIKCFNAKGHAQLTDFLETKGKIHNYSLGLDFLVGGFSGGEGYLFSASPGDTGVAVNRHDIPGFHAIGSGSTGASYMLYYRELTYKAPARKALYYAMEAKLFGEQAGGVSEGTDVYIATADGKFIPLDEDKTIEKKLVKVWEKLRPQWIERQSAEVLNSIPELNGFPLIEKDENGKPFPPPKPKRSHPKPSEESPDPS